MSKSFTAHIFVKIGSIYVKPRLKVIIGPFYTYRQVHRPCT